MGNLFGKGAVFKIENLFLIFGTGKNIVKFRSEPEEKNLFFPAGNGVCRIGIKCVEIMEIKRNIGKISMQKRFFSSKFVNNRFSIHAGGGISFFHIFKVH